MAELADALDLGSSTARCEGSSPFIRIPFLFNPSKLFWTVDRESSPNNKSLIFVQKYCLFGFKEGVAYSKFKAYTFYARKDSYGEEPKGGSFDDHVSRTATTAV